MKAAKIMEKVYEGHLSSPCVCCMSLHDYANCYMSQTSGFVVGAVAQ
jgi:hypothetical protein